MSELEVVLGFQTEGIDKEKLESNSNCGYGESKSILMLLELNMRYGSWNK